MRDSQTGPRRSRDAKPARLARLGTAALLGALAAAAALAAGQVVAIFTGASSAPVYAVGAAAVNLTPAPLKDYAVAHFGVHDKQLLIAGILAALTGIALLAGIAAMRGFALGAALIALFGAVGVAAAETQPQSGPSWALPSVLGAAAGIGALRLLTRAYHAARTQLDRSAGIQPDHSTRTEHDHSTRIRHDPGRRRFVATAAGLAAGSAVVGVGADLIATRRSSVAAARAAVRIPRPAYPAAPLPYGVHPNVAGLSPFFTDNEVFYRVDTALVLPQVRPDSWTLRVHGMVDRPIELSFADLLHLPLHEHDVTVSCVSDPVGGPYVGNARWIGASLPDLLRAAGVRRGADQLLARSVEGMTIGTPLGSVLDGREALIAVAMNGEPLPVAHGFPARVVVPGFYGYASACKWVTDLYVTTFAASTAYWVQRGYARVGTMKTQSRIDVPKPFARVAAGPVTVAGIAWATGRAIQDVQVRVDQGPWQSARLAAQDGPDTWRQWTYDWHATPGSHGLQVRAADSSGRFQTEARADPLPDGASGWERVVVTVV
ncbi:molybdopterin-dependent oxidoreductase [Actinocrinis puniceicyclus]|uniref:Molybdopterin-dependent oxidoreductase n=1 Tax=Actinocrinis puniceicyclus TaxID=977794 RepID=A0A8J8BAV8_9ACTN|nr:molybdopterin-dependent oxidoreductase [Actinocrinis puniceicyclus]MBS2963367.1 molybdopterin-dependent oxidoreductase [Actinocrinis puniceicyclus]